MPTEAGVVLFVAPSAGTPAQLEKLVQCHRAFLRIHGGADDEGPLALPGLHVLVRGDPSGLALELTIDDPTLVGELQRRAANQLELARRYSATHH
jgi:hypothetical protein